MRNFLTAIILFFTLVPLFAQKKTLTLSQAVSGRYRQFKPESFDFAQWRGNSDEITWNKAYAELKATNIQTKNTRTVLTLETLNAAAEAAGSKKFGYFPYQYEWISDNEILLDGDAALLSYNVSTSKATLLAIKPEGSENHDYNKASGYLAFTEVNNLYISKGTDKPVAVTSDENKAIVNGSNYVHRQEFGIDKGIFWSPDGSALAYYRKDESMVADYPLVNTSERIATLHNIKYPMAGMTSEQVTLVVYYPATGKKVTMKTDGPKDQYLTAITWDPGSAFVYIGVLNREQNHLRMNKYDAKTGDLAATLFEEKNNAWVEPEKPLHFLKKSPSLFLWESERNGFNHLYLYDTNGKLIRQISNGNFPVTKFIGFDEAEQNVYYQCADSTGLQRHLWMAPLKKGNPVCLSKAFIGTNEPEVRPDGKYYFLNHQAQNTPGKMLVLDTKLHPTELLNAENPLEKYDMPVVEMLSIKAADGKTMLNGRLVKPLHMDPSKKYPVIVYVYGGPHAQMVNNEWLGGAPLWDIYMAQQGYAVFTLDNRGSAHRGFAFESVIHRNLGKNEMADQMKGVEYLKSLPWIDASRMGVHGWSFGGFMTISLMLDQASVFKAGVAGGPVCDWKFYEVMYGERYMDTPEENPEGYIQTAVTGKADKLKGKLLVIHGAQDPVVVWQHSIEFVQSCIRAGKQLDYFIYPEHEHNVTGPDRVHLMEKITEYFNLHLK
jgi:dipeptidyl-peptidase-4